MVTDRTDVRGRKDREDPRAGLRQIIYYNGNEGFDVPEVHDYFSPIKNLDQLKALKPGESIWEQDTELSPHGRVYGFTKLQLTEVTSYQRKVHIAYEGLSTGEQDVTKQNLRNLFTLKNPEGLTALINKYGDRLTTVEGFGLSDLSRGNYRVTAGDGVFRELGVPNLRKLGIEF